MYNEEADIGKHLTKLSQAIQENHSLLILDDGSTDNSKTIVKEFAKKMPIHILEHNPNKGLSTTLNDLFYAAAQKLDDNDILIIMDSDDTHDPKYIQEIITCITNGANFVVLSRYQKESKEVGYAFYKRFLSATLNTALKILFPIPSLRDYTSGYRGFKGDLVKKLAQKYPEAIITAKGFAGMAEIMLKLRAFDLTIHEIPFIYRYDLKQGTSKLRLGITIKEYGKVILKAKFGFLK